MERKCDAIGYFKRDLISEFSKNATNAIGKTDEFLAVLCRLKANRQIRLIVKVGISEVECCKLLVWSCS